MDHRAMNHNCESKSMAWFNPEESNNPTAWMENAWSDSLRLESYLGSASGGRITTIQSSKREYQKIRIGFRAWIRITSRRENQVIIELARGPAPGGQLPGIPRAILILVIRVFRALETLIPRRLTDSGILSHPYAWLGYELPSGRWHDRVHDYSRRRTSSRTIRRIWINDQAQIDSDTREESTDPANGGEDALYRATSAPLLAFTGSHPQDRRETGINAVRAIVVHERPARSLPSPGRENIAAPGLGLPSHQAMVSRDSQPW